MAEIPQLKGLTRKLYFCRPKMLILMFLVSDVSRVCQSAEIVDRLEYGILFKPVGDIQISTHHWRHTFEVSLPKLSPMSGFNPCWSENTRCAIINSVNTQINALHAETSGRYNKTLETVLKLLPDGRQGKRSARSIPEYKDKLSNAVTLEDANAILEHLMELANHAKTIADSLKQDGSHSWSVLATSSDHINSLKNEIHKIHTELKTAVGEYLSNAYPTRTILNQIYDMFDKYVKSIGKLSFALEEILEGMIDLSKGKLTPSLVPPTSLESCLEDIRQKLAKTNPNFHIAIKSIQDIYTSGNVQYERKNRTVFLTINVPVSPSLSSLQLFEVKSYPVPINSSSRHATQILDLPDYFAISSDKYYFMELSGNEIQFCPEYSNFRCSFNTPLSIAPMSNSCLLSLFENRRDVIQEVCNFRFSQDVIQPELVNLNDSSVLVFRTRNLEFECGSKNISSVGCDYCVVQMPCHCSVLTPHSFLQPRSLNCGLEFGNVTIKNYLNLILLQLFFNRTIYKSINVTGTNVSYPDDLKIPKFKIYSHELHDSVADDTKVHLSLDKMVKAAKLNTFVYQSLTDSHLDGLVEPKPQTDEKGFTISTAFISVAIAVVSLFFTIFVLLRMQTLSNLIDRQQRTMRRSVSSKEIQTYLETDVLFD